MSILKDKTIFITGASRGIGREIALKCAADGANIVIVAKTAEPHPKLEGTIHSVADEVVKAGGQALPLQVDVRSEDAVKQAVEQAAQHFSGIDVLINNASAIMLTDTENTPMKRFDLMMSVNMRATFLASQTCLPYLKKSEHAQILTLSPPLNMNPEWFADHCAYTMSKYGMSMCTLGMAKEFEPYHIAVNSLWPKTVIATAAIQYNFPEEVYQLCRKPVIMADAAHVILSQNPREHTGNFYIDEEVLREQGVKDFDQYALNPGQECLSDLFL